MADSSGNEWSPSSQSQSQCGQLRAGAARSRATVRASLACVPCRSRHVKCDGNLPACTRCQLEEKSCVYAKSRRGVRGSKKDSMLKEDIVLLEQEHISDSTPSPGLYNLNTPIEVAKPLPGGWTKLKKQSPRPVEYLFDNYYTYFHDTHSWLPPRKTLSRLIEADPDEFQFVLAMIMYIGSVYTKNIDTGPLREKAYDMASGYLPIKVWNVQALLCICIAAFGEGFTDRCHAWFGRTIDMALHLGLQNKSFADAAEDPVLAESFRRTYWALYIHGSLRIVREHLGHYQLYSTAATTELPCEEWEYQAGEIPTPTSIEEYDRTATMKDHSSWAYLVGLTRICGESVVPLLNVGPIALPEAVDDADHRVVSWLMQLPQWKKELVDPDGAVDMILYHALGIAHGLRIRIQLHLHGAGVNFNVSDVAARGPIFRPSSLLPPEVATRSVPWLYGSTAFHASLGLVALFRFHLPPEKFSPSCILGLERAIMPLVDTYLFGGSRPPLLRDKIMLLVKYLGKVGEFWPLSNKVSEEVTKVMEQAEGISSEVSGEPRGLAEMFSTFMSSPGENEATFSFATPMTAEDMGVVWSSMSMNVNMSMSMAYPTIKFEDR